MFRIRNIGVLFLKHICFKNDAFRLKERGIVRLSGDRLGMVSLAFASYTICAKY